MISNFPELRVFKFGVPEVPGVPEVIITKNSGIPDFRHKMYFSHFFSIFCINIF